MQCQNSRNNCKNSVSALKGSLAAKDSEISALKTEIRELQSKHHGSISMCENKLGAALSQLASSRASLTQCTKDRNAAQLDAEHLRKSRERMDESIRSLSSEVQAMTIKLKEKLNQIRSLESKLKIETDLFNAAKRDSETLRLEVVKFRDQVAREAAEVAALQKQYDSMTDKNSNDALALKASLAARLAAAAENAKKLEQMNAQLQSRLKQLQSLEASLKLQNEELKKHQDLHSQTSLEMKKLQHSLMTLTGLRNQLAKDLESRTALADKLQKQIDSLTLSLQSCKDSERGNAGVCKAKIRALAEELETAKKAHAASVSSLAAAKSQLEGVSLKLSSCNADISNRKRAEARLMSKLSKCRTSQQSCRSDLKQSKESQRSCKKKNSEFRQMIKDLSAQHTGATSALLKRLATAEADAKVYKKRLSKCTSRLSTSSSKISAQGTVINKKQKRIESLKDELAKVNALKRSLSAEIASRVQKIAKLESIMKNKQNEIQSLKKDLASANNVDAERTRKLAQQIRVLQKAISEHQAERKKLQVENLSLNHKYKEAMKKLAELGSVDVTDRKEIAAMKRSIAVYASRIEKYKQDLVKARQSVRLISQKMSQTRKLFSSLKQERDDARALADKFKRLLGQLSKVDQRDDGKYKSLKIMVRRLNRRVASLNSELDRANAVKKNLRSLLREHKVMISGLRRMLRSRPSGGQYNELVRALRASRENIRALKGQLQQYADANEDKRRNINALKGQLQQYADANEDKRQNINALKGQLQQYADTDDVNRQNIKVLKGKLQQAAANSKKDNRRVEITIHGSGRRFVDVKHSLQEEEVPVSDSQ